MNGSMHVEGDGMGGWKHEIPRLEREEGGGGGGRHH